MTPISLHDHTLHLLPEGAAMDMERRALFLADLHLGKTAIFRESGISVPDGPDATVLDRLAALVAKTDAETLVVLGDLFHARGQHMRKVLSALRGWRERRSGLKWIATPGNHDRHVPWKQWLPGAEILAEGAEFGPWTLAHHPPDSSERPVLCGHLHPGVALGSAKLRRVRLPCFWRRRGVLVLPAFGEFTGLKLIQRESGDQVWVTIEGQTREVPAAT